MNPIRRPHIRAVTRVIATGVLLVLVTALAMVGYNTLLNPWTRPPETIEPLLAIHAAVADAAGQ